MRKATDRHFISVGQPVSVGDGKLFGAYFFLWTANPIKKQTEANLRY